MKMWQILILLFFVNINFNLKCQTFEELTESGYEAQEKRDYQIAINFYQKALDLDNNNHYLYNKLSLMHYYLNNSDSSIYYCNKTLKLFPNDTVALYQKGHTYLDLSDFTNSLENFNKAFEITLRSNPHAAFNIGKSYFGLGNIEKAIEYYKETLKLDKNDKYSFYELGVCYASLNKVDKENSLFYYNKAIEQDSNYDYAYYNRGLLYASQFENLKQAHYDLEKSLEINPKNYYASLYNGILYREEGQEGSEELFFKANKIFDNIIENFPNFSEAYYERALTWYKIGILNMVCKDLEQAIKLGHSKSKEIMDQVCNK